MIDREDVAQREKRGNGGVETMETAAERGYPRRWGLPQGRSRRGATPEGGVSLGAEDEGGSVNHLLTSLFPSLFTPPRGSYDNLIIIP